MENNINTLSVNNLMNITIFLNSNNTLNDVINFPHTFKELNNYIIYQCHKNDKFYIYFILKNDIIPIQNENDYEKLKNISLLEVNIQVKFEPYKDLKKKSINDIITELNENNKKNFKKKKEKIKNIDVGQIDSFIPFFEKIINQKLENFQLKIFKDINSILKINYINIDQKLNELKKDILFQLNYNEKSKIENNKEPKLESNKEQKIEKKDIMNNKITYIKQKNKIKDEDSYQEQSLSENQYNEINKNINNLSNKNFEKNNFNYNEKSKKENNKEPKLKSNKEQKTEKKDIMNNKIDLIKQNNNIKNEDSYQDQSLSEIQYNEKNKNIINLSNKKYTKKDDSKRNAPKKNPNIFKNENRNNNLYFNKETPYKPPNNLDISNISNKDEPLKLLNKIPDNNNIEKNNNVKNDKKIDYNYNNNVNNIKENNNNEKSNIKKDNENLNNKIKSNNLIGFNQSTIIYSNTRNSEIKNEEEFDKQSKIIDNADFNKEKFNEEENYLIDYQNCVKNVLISSLYKKEAYINIALKNVGNVNWPRDCYLCFIKEGNDEDGLYFDDEIINGGKEVAPEQIVKVRINILKERNYKNNKEDYLINYEIKQNKVKRLNKEQSGVSQINIVRRNQSSYK